MPQQVEEASRSEQHWDILKKVGPQWRDTVRRQRQGVLSSYFVHQMVKDEVSPSSCTSCRTPSATIATHWLLIASTLRFRCGEGRHHSVVFRSLKDKRRSILAASCDAVCRDAVQHPLRICRKQSTVRWVTPRFRKRSSIFRRNIVKPTHAAAAIQFFVVAFRGCL